MVYVNQIELIGKGVKENKFFLEKVYSSGLEQMHRWFDKLDCSVSIRRQDESEMTLEKFVRLIDKKSSSMLQVNSPTLYKIRYSVVLEDSKNITRFVWMECPDSQININIISDIYKQSFGCELKDEPVIPGLIEYYEWRKKHYTF